MKIQKKWVITYVYVINSKQDEERTDGKIWLFCGALEEKKHWKLGAWCFASASIFVPLKSRRFGSAALHPEKLLWILEGHPSPTYRP